MSRHQRRFVSPRLDFVFYGSKFGFDRFYLRILGRQLSVLAFDNGFRLLERGFPFGNAWRIRRWRLRWLGGLHAVDRLIANDKVNDLAAAR